MNNFESIWSLRNLQLKKMCWLPATLENPNSPSLDYIHPDDHITTSIIIHPWVQTIPYNTNLFLYLSAGFATSQLLQPHHTSQTHHPTYHPLSPLVERGVFLQIDLL